MPLRTPQELVKFLVAEGYSQAVIAERAGVKQPTISRILSGDHDDPKSSVLIRLNQFADEVHSQSQISRGHAGRQPPSSTNILDTIPAHSVVLPAIPPSFDPKEKP